MATVEQLADRAVNAGPLAPEQIKSIERTVKALVRHFDRLRLGDADEMRQEAWVGALEAARTWRDDGGAALSSWVFRHASTRLALTMTRMRSPVYLPKGAVAAGVGPTIRRTSEEAAERVPDGAADLDRRARADRARSRLESSALARRAAYKRAAARLRGGQREMVEACLARAWLDMPMPEARAAAEEFGISPAEASKAMRRMRDALREDPEVLDALDAYDELEETA